MPITTKVSLNPGDDEVYSIQHAIQFSQGNPVFSTNKTEHHDNTEIALRNSDSKQ